MTEFDILCLSLGLNIGLLAALYSKNQFLRKTQKAFEDIYPIMEAIADGKAMPYRDGNTIRIRNLLKERSNEVVRRSV